MNAMTPIPLTKAPAPRPQMATYDARALVQDGTQACILLDDTAYFLRITKSGKLILTK